MRFLMVAAPVVVVAMIVLGNWASDRIEQSTTKSAAEAGAIFLQAFLQPFVQDLPPAGAMSAEAEQPLDRLLATEDLRQRFILLKIWRLDGTLVYSSHKNIPPFESAEEQIRVAASGQLAQHFEELDEVIQGVAPADNIRLLEVYAPLYRTGTSQIIAVGEFYQSAVAMIEEQHATRVFTWGIVAAITTSMLSLLLLIVAQGSRTIQQQRESLERQVNAASKLASQNNALRRVAEHARVDASETNENYLSRIGADIHDGPIQTLSSLMLSLQYGRDGQMSDEPIDSNDTTLHASASTIQLAKALYAELRNISTGLILPEIPTASLPHVFEMAVSRYEATTGGIVKLTLKTLPEDAPPAVKICCYRIVQEGLNNSHRHGGGKGQHVIAGASQGRLRIMLLDSGEGFDPTEGQHKGLGLVGMRNRVKALKGKISVHSRPGRGTRIYVALPIDPEA
ncbi:ATP-binding protein [Devosia sp.]|uniref:sensor histidine kinase n=1 Tax=Devosia sp. TaxID=1871048 RepID=UPI00260B24D5|nr:ATP-binding protein [Devosia sp.]